MRRWLDKGNKSEEQEQLVAGIEACCSILKLLLNPLSPDILTATPISNETTNKTTTTLSPDILTATNQTSNETSTTNKTTTTNEKKRRFEDLLSFFS